jgi:hypothetical protein
MGWTIVGMLVVVLFCLAGTAVGLVDRVIDDPETKLAIEQRKKELERQKAWRDKQK